MSYPKSSPERWREFAKIRKRLTVRSLSGRHVLAIALLLGIAMKRE